MKYKCINSLFFIPLYILLLYVGNYSLLGQKKTSKNAVNISTYFDRTESDTILDIEKLKDIDHFLKVSFLHNVDSLIYKGFMRKTKILNKLKMCDSAIYYSKVLYDYAKEKNNLVFQEKALTKLGIYHKKENQLDQSFIYHNEAFKISRTSKDSLDAGKSLLYMANIQNSLGDYIGSKTTAIDGLRYLENTHSVKRISGLLLNISVAYYELGDYSKSLAYNSRALSLLPGSLFIKKTGKSTFLKLKTSEANILAHQKKYDQSIDILLELLSDATVNKSKTEYTRVLSNLGYIKWLENPNNLTSDSLLKKSLKIRKVTKDIKGLISSNIHLAKYYLNIDKKKALEYAERAYLNARKRNSMAAILESLGLIFKLKKDLTEEAKVYQKVSEKLKSINQKNQDIYSVTKYENEKLEKKHTEQTLQTLYEKNQKIIYFSISIGLVFVIGFVTYFFIRRNKDLKQKSVQLKQQNKIDKLEASYNERVKFSKKIHDSFAANLYGTMILLQNDTDRSKILDQLDILYNQSRDFSRENSEIDTGENYKNELSGMLHSYIPVTAQLYITGINDINWEQITALDKIALYTTVQELMINMKKHSQADIVTVTFTKDKNHLKVHYSDDGIGASFEEMNRKNGLKNTESRIEAIKGAIIFDTKKGDGFKAEIQIPN